MNRNCGIHVSHRIGNSLCSHPALLISDFGGIWGVERGRRIGGSWKVEVKCSIVAALVWRKQWPIVLVSTHHVGHSHPPAPAARAPGKVPVSLTER